MWMELQGGVEGSKEPTHLAFIPHPVFCQEFPLTNSRSQTARGPRQGGPEEQPPKWKGREEGRVRHTGRLSAFPILTV